MVTAQMIVIRPVHIPTPILLSILGTQRQHKGYITQSNNIMISNTAALFSNNIQYGEKGVINV